MLRGLSSSVFGFSEEYDPCVFAEERIGPSLFDGKTYRDVRFGVFLPDMYLVYGGCTKIFLFGFLLEEI